MLRTIIVLILILAVVSYFGFNLKDFINNPTVRSNFAYVWDFVKDIWDKYLKNVAMIFWNSVFVDTITKGIKDNLDVVLSGGWVGATTTPSTISVPYPEAPQYVPN